ncbi:MAG: hypothetical protein IK123_12055, partial [Lachnospiraceae bacterium]|nr:hypothetical protein [Lachnospiraceae bacterium]
MNVAMEYKLPVSMLGIGTGLKYRTKLTTDRDGFKMRGRTVKDEEGILTVTVEAGGAVILRHKKFGRRKKMPVVITVKKSKDSKSKNKEEQVEV